MNMAEGLSREIQRVCQIRFGQILPMDVSHEIDDRLEVAHAAAGSGDALEIIQAYKALQGIGAKDG